MEYKNTLQKGSVRYIILKEGTEWIGVALDFNMYKQFYDLNNATKITE